MVSNRQSYFLFLAATTIFVSVLCLFCVPNTSAQVSRVAATLEGTVRDSSGAAVVGSKATLRNSNTGQSRSVTTDSQGFFRAEQLAVGTYEVGVEQQGFASYRQSGVLLELGQTLHLDIVLSTASAAKSVTVSAQPAVIDTSQTSFVSSVDQERIEELPVRNRNYLDFVLLAPGVSSSPVASGATPRW